MDAYAEWMRRSSTLSREDDADARRTLRSKYAEWQAYGDALGEMYAKNRELAKTEHAAGQIVASKKLIAASAIIAGATALGLALAAGAAPWLLKAGAGPLMTGAVTGAVAGAASGGGTSGGLALLEGASVEDAALAALEGAGWGGVLGALGGYYGARLSQRFAPPAFGALGEGAAAGGRVLTPRERVRATAKGGGAASHVIGANDLSTLPRAAPGTDTVVLGPFTRESKITLPGGREIVGIEQTLETTLQPAAQQLGGRTLSGFPGRIEALAPEIQKADRIVFFTTEGKLGPLTQAEMDLVQSSAELRAKTIFVHGGIR